MLEQYGHGSKNVPVSPSIPEEQTPKRQQIPAKIISQSSGSAAAASDPDRPAVPLWIVISSVVILYNKYLYTSLKYPYVSGLFLVPEWHE